MKDTLGNKPSYTEVAPPEVARGVARLLEGMRMGRGIKHTPAIDDESKKQELPPLRVVEYTD